MSTSDGDPRPLHLDLDRERGLTIDWSDGARILLPIAVLRRHSPSADQHDTGIYTWKYLRDLGAQHGKPAAKA